MNILSKIIIVVFLFIVVFLIVVPLTIDKEIIKSQIEQQISQELEVEFATKHEVKIRFLPIPQISLKDVGIKNLLIGKKYYGNINIKKLIIRPTISSFFSKKTQIRTLIFENPKIETHQIAKKSKIENKSDKKINKAISDSKVINFYNNKKQIFTLKRIQSIYFKNGSFVNKTSNNESATKFTQINFLLKNQTKNQILTANGDFFADDTPTTFNLSANLKDNEDSILTIQSPIINLLLSGNFANANINNLIDANFSGKIDVNIINPKALLSKYFSKKHLLCRKIYTTQPLKISANINNRNKKISIYDAIISSQLINGRGKAIVDLSSSQTKINTHFDFDNIDIDSIWFSGISYNDNRIIKDETRIIKEFIGNKMVKLKDTNISQILPNKASDENVNTKTFLNNLDFTAKIKIKKAGYYDGSLKNISLSFVTHNNEILLQPLIASIEGGSLVANGVFMSDGNIPKFTGQIKINGSNLFESLSWLKINSENLKLESLGKYSFDASLLALPDFVVFNSFNLKVNNNIMVGNLIIDDSSSNSISKSNLRINYLDYDDYFVVDKKSPYLSGGSMIEKLFWLNTINSRHDINLIVDRLIYQKNDFGNQALKIKFGQGYLGINDVDLHLLEFDMKGNFDIDIRNNNPRLNLNIISKNWQYESEELWNKFFNLASLERFDGKIDVKIDNFKLNDWQGENILIGGKMKNGIINFDDFSLKIYGGDVKYRGSAVLKNNKSVNGSLEMLKIDNAQFLSHILGIKNVFGISNISAIVNSGGMDQRGFLENFSGKAKFVSGNIVIDGFGIDDLAMKMAQPIENFSRLIDPDNILYAEDAKSFFVDASGAVELSKGGDGKFNIKSSNVGINGVIYGGIKKGLFNNSSANFIFISGTRQAPIPINLAVNFTGKSGEIQHNTNYGQIEQYLSNFK